MKLPPGGRARPTEPSRPEWSAAFLADRGARKPSVQTMKAYRQARSSQPSRRVQCNLGNGVAFH